MWIFIIAAIALVSLVIVKYNRRTQLRKAAKLSSYQTKEELLRASETASEVGRYSVPNEEAIMMKAPRASAFSENSNDQRETALSEG